MEYLLDDFDFDLPADLIAQYPAERREDARLLVLDRTSGLLSHSTFSKLHEFLRRGDLLVFNDARVMRARVACRRESGGIVEVILLASRGATTWSAIASRTKRLKPGTRLVPLRDTGMEFTVQRREGDTIVIESNKKLDGVALGVIGELPLPPYIARNADDMDEERYQTVFAKSDGAIAAPTAGLHFTGDYLDRLGAMGVEKAHLTLLVSWGTFQPVRTNRISEHRMHTESYLLGVEAAGTINRARGEGRRIIAVGTTSLRVLESTYRDGCNLAGEGETDLFLYPPMRIESIDAMITNFHTPRSTLLMLVSAFAGRDAILAAYREAIERRYRFFSYGDAMLIL